MTKKLRTYEPIWIKLKATGKARVAALPEMHRRIYKAVHKEKDLDVAYKLQQELEGKKMELIVKYYPNRMEFTLRTKGLHVGDL